MSATSESPWPCTRGPGALAWHLYVAGLHRRPCAICDGKVHACGCKSCGIAADEEAARVKHGQLGLFGAA